MAKNNGISCLLRSFFVVLMFSACFSTPALSAPVRLPDSHQRIIKSHRSLQASCPPLVISGTTHTFDNCEDLTSTVGSPFFFYYTINNNILTGGLKAASPNGWASIAFAPRGRMLGAQAIMVMPDSSPSGASVDGYILNSYSASVINADKGTFPLTNTAAEKSADGTLSAAFTATMPTPASASQSMLYVVDGSMRAGEMGTHVGVGSQYGSFFANLVASPSTAATTATTTATPTPITAESLPATAAPIAAASSTTATTATNAATTAASSPQIAPAAKACTVTVAGNQQNYRTCYSVNGIGTDFQILYSVDPDPNNATSSILSMAMSATSSGYVAVGFPTKAGSMTDASSVILQVCTSCPTGASATQYWMTGTAMSDMHVSNQLGATNISASATAAGNGPQLMASFQVVLPGFSLAAARRRRSLLNFIGTTTAFPLIYAAGDLTSTGGLMEHYDKGSGSISLLDGAPGTGAPSGNLTADGVGEVSVSSTDAYKNAHSWLMVIGWGFFIPIGIITARYFRSKGCWWFRVHSILQSFSFIMVVVALALGFVANDGWETDLPVHRDLGIAATALGLVQVISLVARPNPDHKHRYIWTLWHHWIGRSAAILAIANIYYGIIVVDELGTWAWAAYTGVLGAVVVVAVVLEILELMHKRRTVDASKKGLAVDSSSAGNSENGKAFITGNSSFNNGYQA